MDHAQVANRKRLAQNILGGTKGPLKINGTRIQFRIADRSGNLVAVGKKNNKMPPINPEDLRPA